MAEGPFWQFLGLMPDIPGGLEGATSASSWSRRKDRCFQLYLLEKQVLLQN